jgi:hypothetical protein
VEVPAAVKALVPGSTNADWRQEVDGWAHRDAWGAIADYIDDDDNSGDYFSLAHGVVVTSGDASISDAEAETAGQYDVCVIYGSRNMAGVVADRIKIGCRAYSLDYWRNHYEEVAEDHNYTEDEAEEYKTYIEVLGKVYGLDEAVAGPILPEVPREVLDKVSGSTRADWVKHPGGGYSHKSVAIDPASWLPPGAVLTNV